MFFSNLDLEQMYTVQGGEYVPALLSFIAKEELWNSPHQEGKQVNISFNNLGTEFCGVMCPLKNMLIYVFTFTFLSTANHAI